MRVNVRRGAWPLAALALAMFTTASANAELVLVEKGKALAPIVIFQDAPPLTRKAADELAQYIEKTSGAKVQVIEGEPKPMPEKAIWVGYQPALKQIFPKVDFEFKHPEEILIAANDKHLVIAGRDRWDPQSLLIEGRRGSTINGRQQEYGTCNAVYTFLQDHLGVRWLWPGELGEDILKKDTLSFAPFEYRYHPQIRSRGGTFNFSMFGNLGGYGRAHDWTRLQRIQLGSLDSHGGHAFTTWFERFHKDHPDWFALQPDGTRSDSANARTVKMCHSNPAVAKQWLVEVEEALKKDPNLVVFSASPNDGWMTGHCVCDNCRAWDHPDGELRMFNWRGISQEYVALSDRDVTFANACAKLLKERYPDKDYYVLMLSYGHSRPAPIKARPAENVIISSVANCFSLFDGVDRGSSLGTMYRQQFEDWAKMGGKMYWRPNTGSPAGWQQGQPDVQMTQIIKTFKFIAENRAIGIFIDGTWEHWGTQGPQYYLMAHLTWNPSVDGQAVLQDYYQRGFGKAAGDIKTYWTLLENTRETFLKSGDEYWKTYDKAFFEQAYGHLDRAAAAVAQGPEIYRKRLAFVRAGLDYTQAIITVREHMARFKKSNGKDAEAEKIVRENWAKMEKIGKDHPYTINWGPLRPGTPRMAALHPDHYKKTK